MTDSALQPERRRPGRPSLSNEELLEKALDLFLEKGFAGTSIDAICAAAGMAKRTVYARYGDKEALFKAALTRAIEDWLVPVDTLRAQESDDLEESLLRIGALLVQNVLGPKGLRLLRLTNAESVMMPEIAQENVRLGTEPTLAYLSDLFGRHLGGTAGQFAGVDSGADSGADSGDAAQAFLSLVVGGPASNAAWGMRLDPSLVERHVRYSVHLFLHGVLDRAPTGSAQDEGAERRRLLGEAEEALVLARQRIEQAGRLA